MGAAMTAASWKASRSGLRAALVVAAAASAGAGLVHAAASGSHSGTESLVVWLFAGCAAAQLGWAAAVVLIPTRPVLFLGVGINGAAVVAWFMSRTVGLPVVDALAEVEALGTQDLVAGVLGALAVAATVLAITQPISRRTMPSSWTAMVAVGTVALVIPAMAGGHTHGGHDHLAAANVHAGAGGDAHSHEDGESDDGHAHSVALAAGVEHSHDGGDDASDADHGHDSNTSSSGSTSASHAHATTGSGTPAPHSDDGHHSNQPGNPAAPSGSHPHDPTTPGSAPHSPTAPAHDHPPATPGQPAPPVHPPGQPHDHPPTPTPTGPIVSIDDPRLTAAQRSAAGNLLYTTVQAMAAFPTVAAVEAAGYRSIGDASTGFEHFVNWTYFYDGIELDPGRIESIVIQIGPGGTKAVASAMYILTPGKSCRTSPGSSRCGTSTGTCAGSRRPEAGSASRG